MYDKKDYEILELNTHVRLLQGDIISKLGEISSLKNLRDNLIIQNEELRIRVAELEDSFNFLNETNDGLLEKLEAYSSKYGELEQEEPQEEVE